MSRSGPIRRLVIVLVLGALGGSPPEVVRVRVPAAKVSSWFPHGSDLQVLTYDRFEALAKAAFERPAASRAPRLLKARHSARWESGRLDGKTELIVEPGDASPAGFLILDPWSPSLLEGGQADRLRSTIDGRLALKVGAGSPRVVEFGWTLRAGTASEGKAFAIELPTADLASLSVDLPAGLEPEASAGPRIGPDPGREAGRSTWTFESAQGKLALRLKARGEDSERPDPARRWLEGTTTIDLGSAPINWRADWTLDGQPVSRGTLRIGVDPGIDVVDVTGPRVASFRIEPDGEGSTVAVAIEGEGTGPTPLAIRGICQAPSEGPWVVPSARPLDATWAGGRTIVRPDPSRVVLASVERSGRRVAPRPGMTAGPADLIFEPKGGPGPVAELIFGGPSADATAEVRGWLRFGDEAPRLVASLTWTVEKGRLLSHAIELPAGWTVDGVRSPDGQPVAWHAVARSHGGATVHLAPSIADDGSGSFAVTLSATAGRAGVAGPLDLPRVRPAAGVRAVDEVWVATREDGVEVRPIMASGLAWLDPPEPTADAAPTPWPAAGLRGALAWRWLADDAEARVDRTLSAVDPRGSVGLRASIRPGRLMLDWTVDVESPAGDLDPVPIHVDGLVDGPISWNVEGAGGSVVEPVAMDEARRATLGFPATGTAWELRLSGGSRGKVRLWGRLERPWTGRGSIPVLGLPARYKPAGTVSVFVPYSTRAKFEPSGLIPIAPPEAEGDSTVGVTSTEPGMRLAGSFGYGSAGGRLSVETTPPPAGPEGGLIREAWLTSMVELGSGIRHRLNLGIAADSAQRVSLRMPAGVAIDRLRLDGSPVAPIPSGDDLLIELPAPTPGKPLCSLTIEYRTGDDPRDGPLVPTRLLPKIGLPCLAFSWEVDLPEGWEPARSRGGLRATDPRPVPSTADRWLGFVRSPWRDDDDAGRTTREGVEALRDLDRAASEIATGEMTLGGWLLKLDAGRRPLAVDRLAVRSIGLGPATRIESTLASTNPLGPVRSILEPMGLVATPLGGVILITASDAVPSSTAGRDAWASALRAVASEGSDPTDRFQSASRWRREATPRAPASGEAATSPGRQGSRRPWRFASTGWPAAGASVELADVRSDRAWGWFVASVVLVAGLLFRRMPDPARAVGLVAIGLAGVVGLAWRWPEVSSVSSGLLAGGLGVLAFWFGRSTRAPASGSPDTAPTTSRWSRLGRGSAVVPLLVAVTWVGGIARGGLDGDRPILALLPFDGPVDPNARPERVVMLVKDVERLDVLARRDPGSAPAVVSLISARHRVRLDAPGLAGIESEYEVEVEGKGPAAWTLPVGQELELTAEVGAGHAPLAIAPDGRSAEVSLEGEGVHRVRFRRLARLSTIGRDGEGIKVPINRSAAARVEVARGDRPRWVDVVAATGEVRAEEGGIAGSLGPLGTLEVHWFPGDHRPELAPRGPVEAAYLWDASAGGDLIRLRLTHSDPQGAAAIRIAIGPGVAVRRHAIPNVVSTRIEGTADRPEWVAFVDPPAPPNIPIEVEFWRVSPPGESTREWPRIEVVTAGEASALIGFRRPGDWSGRLEARGEDEPVSDQGFVKTWGTLPDDGLTLAGAVRGGRAARPTVETRPVPLRRSVRTRVVVRPGPGRLQATIEATLTDRQGRSFDLEVGVPTDLRVVRLEADGLLGWQRIARERLRLRFENLGPLERTIRIEAHVPAPPEPIMAEPRSYRATVPWPRWIDAEGATGTIEVVGPARVPLEPGAGTTAIVPPAEATGESTPRLTYRVDPGAAPSRVTWPAPPPRVNVAIESELAIDADSMTWVAALDCEVSGGPASSLSLNLPTEWAEGASIEIDGYAHRLKAQPVGPKGETTQWLIVPDAPIWGEARVILRSRRPLRPGREVAYPRVEPLGAAGRGSVGRYDVAIRNGSGRPMEVAGSSGLQPVAVSRLRGFDSSSGPVASRSIDHAYQVTGENWSLELKVGRPGDDRPTSGPIEDARVDAARLDGVVTPDGSTWGRALVDLAAQPGPFLAVRLAEGTSIPWAEVDGDSIVHAFPDASGTWLVPLGDRQPRRVEFAWHRPGRSTDTAEPIVLPFFAHPPASSSLAIDSPAEPGVLIVGAALEPIGRIGWEADLVERTASGLVDHLGRLDRTSRRDREAILDDLTEVELRTRRIARLSVGNDPSIVPTAARVQSALDAIAEAGQAAGLDDLIQEARSRVGLAAPPEELTDGPATVAPEVVQLRRSGDLRYFRARPDGTGRPTTIRPTVDASPTRSWSWASSAIAASGVAFSLMAGWVIAGRSDQRSKIIGGLVLLGLATLLMPQPSGLGAIVALFLWGRRSS